MKITNEHRQAAIAESEKKKSANKMSDAAIAKLRALNEHDATNKAADARLVAEFNKHDLAIESVMDWLSLLRKNQLENLRKRAIKCFQFLSRGFKVYSIHDVSFFGELLPEEERMLVSGILNMYPADVSVIHPALPEAAPGRLCALGSKCLRSYRRKPAVVTGTGKYCCPTCKSTAASLARRPKHDELLPELSEVAILTRINTGVKGGTPAT